MKIKVFHKRSKLYKWFLLLIGMAFFYLAFFVAPSKYKYFGIGMGAVVILAFVIDFIHRNEFLEEIIKCEKYEIIQDGRN